MSILIKNGTVVTATDIYKGDVLVEDERVSVIGTSLSMQADRVIDATGKYLLPGGIDVHTHLDMPFGGPTSADYFAAGTLSGALGGSTTGGDVALQHKGATPHRPWGTRIKEAGGDAAPA